MNAKLLRIFSVLALVFVAVSSIAVTSVGADTPPDILDSYTIAVAPQADGSLVMNYTLQHYCVGIDVWPSDQPYLQIGVPNENFTITDWGPKDGLVTKAEQVTSGGSFVQLDFDQNKLPKKGDCFDLSFSIVQNKMAYPDDTNKQVTFKFIPSGWDFPITVKQLTVTWQLPSDQSLLKVTDPSPMSSDGTNMIWQWNSPVMSSTHMFTDYAVKLAYDPSAFQLSDEAKASSDAANGGSSLDTGTIIIIVIGVVVVLVLIVVVLGALLGDGDYGGGGGIFGGGGDGGGHSGGGGLGGSGGGYSCACAGCACACACAGGGRVGCGRKGIGIRCLMAVIEKVKEKHEDKDT